MQTATPPASSTAAVNYGLGYDPENRLAYAAVSSDSEEFVSYAYDTQNRRNWIWPATEDTFGNQINYTVNAYTPGGQKLGAYTLTPLYNQTLSEMVMQVTATSNDTYFGSRRLAVMDQLGSVVKATAPVVSYFPWGETKGASNPQDTWNFATYWQDSTTGLDYANNRYYSNIGGRFMTPDPSTAGQDPKAPQSWNLYPYVMGDPVNFTDPTGLFMQCDPPAVPSSDGSTCVSPDPGGGGGGPTTGGSDGGGNPGGTTKNHDSGSATTCPAGLVKGPRNNCITKQQLQCDANIIQWTNGLSSDFAAWLDSEFTPLASANATGFKTALGYGISGSQGAIIENLSGAAGAAAGGIIGYVVGFSAAVILDPILDPIIKGAAEGAWNATLYGITRQGYADCEGTQCASVSIGQLRISVRIEIKFRCKANRPYRQSTLA